jgi:hypothetical protein
MAWGVHHLDDHLTHLQTLTIAEPAGGIAEFRPGGSQELNLATSGEFTDASQVVIVLVGVDGVAEAQALSARLREVDIDVSADVKDKRFAGILRPDEVRGVSQAFEIKLLEDHASPPSFHGSVIQVMLQPFVRLYSHMKHVIAPI